MRTIDEAKGAPPEENEVLFLRYFFDAAGNAFGPADYDIYCMIIENFEEDYKVRVPAALRERFFSEEDDE